MPRRMVSLSGDVSLTGEYTRRDGDILALESEVLRFRKETFSIEYKQKFTMFPVAGGSSKAWYTLAARLS